MTIRLGLALGVAGLAVCVLGACSSTGAPAGASMAASGRVETPPRFRGMQRLLGAGRSEAARGDVRALRARSPALTREGMALIKATLPHDVSRTDVPRYLEGRALFGEALKQWVGVVEQGTDAQVLEALHDLDAACRSWIDAYLGLAPETSV